MDDLVKKLNEQQSALKKISFAIGKIERSINAENKFVKIEVMAQEIKSIENSLKIAYIDNAIKTGIDARLAKYKADLADTESKAKTEFGLEIGKSLEAAGYKLAGHYPDLTTSIYTISVDISANSVKIWSGNKQEALDSCKANPQMVVKKIKSIDKDIKERPFEREKFLKGLYAAYKTVLLKSSNAPGEAVPVSMLLPELALVLQDDRFNKNPKKSHYKEYSRAYLGYDLYKIKDRKFPFEGKVREMILIPAKIGETDSKNSRYQNLWVPTGESTEGLLISRIKFLEASS